MKRSLTTTIFFSLLAVSTGGLFAACGGGDNGGGGNPDGGNMSDAPVADNTTPDAGRHPDTGTDTGTQDQNNPMPDTGPGPDTGTDTSMPPTCVLDSGTPPGTLLVSGTPITLWGITDDNYAIYSQPAAGGMFTLSALSLGNGTGDAGAPQMISTVGSNPDVLIQGTTVFAWSNVAAVAPQITALHIWTAASGSHLAAAASIPGIAAANADATKFIFIGNVNAASQGKISDIQGSDATFATVQTLVSMVDTDQKANTCLPSVQFYGPAASSTGVVGHCPGGADAAAGATITTVNTANWMTADVFTAARAPLSISGDTAGTKIFTASSAGEGVVIPLSGAPTVNIDTGVYAGVMFSGGTTVIYGTNAGDLRSAPTTGTGDAGGTVLVSTGVQGFYSILPPDNGHIYTFTQQNSMGFTDLAYAATTAPGALTTLSSTPTATLFGSAWTADSTTALWYGSVANGFGTFHSTTASNGASSTVGSIVWVDYNLGTTGAKVVYNDNGVAGPASDQFRGTADIRVADLSVSPVAPTLVVPAAEVNFNPTTDGNFIVYTYNACVPGMYVVPTP